MDTADLLEPGWTSRTCTIGGVNLHIVEAGPATGRPVILLHGFPEFWWAWRKQIGPLTNAGFRVIVPDLRGYNLSDAPQDVSAYRLDTLVDDVTGIADALGIGRFDLVGHDWGGVIAWRVAARHGGRVARLVILDAPHPAVSLGEMLRHPAQIARSFYVMFFQLPRLPEAMLGAFDFAGLRSSLERSSRSGTFDRATLDRYAGAWQRPGRLTAMLNYYRALRERRSGSPVRIGMPTLVLWGERDSFLSVHVARDSLRRCDDARLDVLPDATHWLHLEQPETVAARIIEHLGR